MTPPSRVGAYECDSQTNFPKEMKLISGRAGFEPRQAGPNSHPLIYSAGLLCGSWGSLCLPDPSAMPFPPPSSSLLPLV